MLGVNGAGKTTTIKMLSCLTPPTSGDAFLLGNSIKTDSNKIKQIINVSPQETAIAPNLSVRENLEFICQIYDFDKSKTKEKVDNIIKELKLGEIEKSKAKILSGGWQRRLSIALALISNPKILFLDEPTLGLDVFARRELWEIINHLKKSMTIILTTHYLEEAQSLADDIAVLSNGKLVAHGTSEELIKLTGTANFEDTFIKLCTKGDK